MTSVEELLCALLRGEKAAWPGEADEQFVSHVIERAEFHGVLPLMHDRFQCLPGVARKWPPALVRYCHEAAVSQAMWELRHRDLLVRALNKLGDIGIQPVLFKGTALAYSLYSSPILRTRADSDLIVPPSLRAGVADALEAVGFLQMQGISCEFVSYEASFAQRESHVAHALDLHWRIHYSQFQSRLFPYKRLRERAWPLPVLGSNAWGACPVDALLLACLHRSNELRIPQWNGDQASYGVDRLIWLYDLHLLIESMTTDQLAEFGSLAMDLGVGALCREGIELSCGYFHTHLPDSLRAKLVSAGDQDCVSRYQRAGMWRQRWMDWTAVDGFESKLAYLREHLLPGEEYLRSKYPAIRRGWLPWLHLRRLVGGVARRMGLPLH